jgi:hypothetical protein
MILPKIDVSHANCIQIADPWTGNAASRIQRSGDIIAYATHMLQFSSEMQQT